MKKGLIVASVVILLAVVGVFLSMQDAENSKYAIKDDSSKLEAVGQEIPDQGRDHIKPGQAHEPYNSNPPTSGPHYEVPAQWGIYNEPLADEQAVHNLEHGGIWITYKDIDEQTKSVLEGIARANGGSVLLSPRPANEAKISVASWTRLEKMETLDEEKILQFIRANKNKSPEPLAL